MEKTPIEKLANKKIFSIEGNIGAGKTTIIKHLQKIFENTVLVEEPVEHWQDVGGTNLLEQKNSDMKRWGYSFESYVLVTKMNELIKAAESDKEIILIERCMLTDKAFFDVNVKNNLCSPMEEAMFTRFYEFLKNVIYPKLSGIIYVNTPPEECINRIKSRGREAEKPIEPSYLNQLNEAFLKVVNESGVPILYIDGKYDLQRGIDDVISQLRDFINKQIGENSN